MTPLLAAILSFALSNAEAGVTISVWSPGLVAFDPYDPMYIPAPRPDYIWIPGGWDEYGYYRPGYWQPVAPRPGYVWSAGYWSAHVYYEGFWRPSLQAGQTWFDGYYVNGRYVKPRWVRDADVERERARRKEDVGHNDAPSQAHPANDPPRTAPTAPAKSAKPRKHKNR